MGRPRKQTVDYFPHFITDSLTKRVLRRYWRNDGYAFWYKLLELLCAEDGHYLDLSIVAKWEDLLAFTDVDEDTAVAILNKMAELEKIDSELWNKDKVVWCSPLIDNLKPVYAKRTDKLPEKPLLREFSERKLPDTGVSGVRNPQSIVEESIVKESIGDTPLIPPEGDAEEISGESLLVETATGEPTQGSHSKTRNRKRKSSGVLSSEQQDRFEIFWAAWPNKKSPGQAEATFSKLDPDDDLLQEILAGIERAKKYDHRFREKRFTPYPSSWLNSKGWQDNFEVETTVPIDSLYDDDDDFFSGKR